MDLELMPDPAVDAALVEVGISYLDIVVGSVRIEFQDGTADLITGVSLRHYLRFRNTFQQYRGSESYVRVGNRFAVNCKEVAAISFAQSDDGAAAICNAIRAGHAGPDALRAFARQRPVY